MVGGHREGSVSAVRVWRSCIAGYLPAEPPLDRARVATGQFGAASNVKICR